MLYFYLFVFGLIIGSFLNVVVWRFDINNHIFSLNKLKGRSHCPYCGKTLQWYELIPIISFIIQKGKCLSCKHQLSWQYPIIEIITGIIFVIVPFYFNKFYIFNPFKNELIILWLLIFIFWLLVSAIDFKKMIIPNDLNFLLLLSGIILNLFLYFSKSNFINNSFVNGYSFMFSFSNSFLVNRLLGLLPAFFLLILFMLSKGNWIGFGDVKLMISSGLILGWPDSFIGILLAFIIGGLIGIILLVFGNKNLKSMIPFGPILILGMIITIFFGVDILKFYFLTFNFI
ncbi:MAG: prepilin peptidase [Minisyncoccia bacterium]